MGTSFNMHQNLKSENLKERGWRDHLGALHIKRRIILKWILKMQGMSVYTRFT
jgi:hypothetical protein